MQQPDSAEGEYDSYFYTGRPANPYLEHEPQVYKQHSDTGEVEHGLQTEPSNEEEDGDERLNTGASEPSENHEHEETGPLQTENEEVEGSTEQNPPSISAKYDGGHDEHVPRVLDDEEPEEDGVDNSLDESDVRSVHGESLEETPEEHAAEYVEAVDSHEDGSEDEDGSYEDDVQATEADGTSSTDEVAASVATREDADEAHADKGREASNLEATNTEGQTMSNSTSSSSFGTVDLSGDVIEESDDSSDQNIETSEPRKLLLHSFFADLMSPDHSVQQSAAGFDEEGNFTEGIGVDEDEFADEDFDEDALGEEDFDESAEGTLEGKLITYSLLISYLLLLLDPAEEKEELVKDVDASEEPENDVDAVSQAVLAESEKFVSDLEKNSDIGT